MEMKGNGPTTHTQRVIKTKTMLQSIPQVAYYKIIQSDVGVAILSFC